MFDLFTQTVWSPVDPISLIRNSLVVINSEGNYSNSPISDMETPPIRLISPFNFDLSLFSRFPSPSVISDAIGNLARPKSNAWLHLYRVQLADLLICMIYMLQRKPIKTKGKIEDLDAFNDSVSAAWLSKFSCCTMLSGLLDTVSQRTELSSSPRGAIITIRIIRTI